MDLILRASMNMQAMVVKIKRQDFAWVLWLLKWKKSFVQCVYSVEYSVRMREMSFYEFGEGLRCRSFLSTEI